MVKGAVVLELNSSHVTLLTDEGAFLRIAATRLPGARYIGQHVRLDDIRPQSYGRWVSVAAACLIIALVIPLLKPTPAQAWVTLDGSSSLEVLLDHRFQILEIHPLNNGGQGFLNDFGSETASFSALVDGYMDWSTQMGDSTMLVTSTSSISSLEEFFNEPSDPVKAVLMEVDPEARDEAQKLGVSTGKALFMAEANNQGVSIPVENIKESNPFSALSSAGANVDEVVTSASDRETQAEKIKDLPRTDPDTAGGKPPQDNPGHGGTPPGQGKEDPPPGQTDKETPPGQKDKDTPGRTDKETPPSQQGEEIPVDSDEDTVLPDQETSSILPPDMLDKYYPRLKEQEPHSWKAEKTGPPFKNTSKGNGSDKGSKDNNGSGKSGNRK